MIYHITRPELWKKAQNIGSYLPSEYKKDGFIHCSNEDQVVNVGNSYYAGQKGLIVLAINPEKLTSKLVYENATGGEPGLFPHIYGSLNFNAIESIADFSQNAAGEFEFPQVWKPAR